jgi:replicative DNA helicase
LSIEVTLLQLLKYRERYEKVHKAVPTVALEELSRIFIADFGAFFKEFPDVKRIEFEPFMFWFKSFQHPTVKPEKLALFAELLKPALLTDCEPALEAGIMGRLVEAEAASRFTDILTRWEQGEERDLYVALREELDRFTQQTTRKVLIPWVEDDIDSILEEDKGNKGLRFRLDCLNAHMRPLRGGDAVIWAGRPGKGKTTGLLSEVTYMAPQFDEYYGPNHGRYALWMNNEGPGKRIVRRAFQSALFASDAELISKSIAGTLKDEYAKAVGGADRIRVMNIHGFWNYDVEEILRRVPPGLVVFDMVDNIKFRGDTTSVDRRTDQTLEAMYQWARELGVKYDCPVISTSQVSAEGAGLQFPLDSMLKDSKTGKQGACDAIIFTGHSTDPTYANSRFMSIAKSKLNLPGQPESPHCEVLFDGERGRLLMPSEIR